MSQLVRGFKRLGKKLALAIVVNLLLTLAAVVLILSPEPRFAVVLVSLQLVMLFVVTAVMYTRLKRGQWKINRVLNANPSDEVDNSTEFERISLMQRRIIGAIETERLEAAERYGKLAELVEGNRPR